MSPDRQNTIRTIAALATAIALAGAAVLLMLFVVALAGAAVLTMFVGGVVGV